eukprot:1609840-Amphidinium_carterae.1
MQQTTKKFLVSSARCHQGCATCRPALRALGEKHLWGDTASIFSYTPAAECVPSQRSCLQSLLCASLSLFGVVAGFLLAKSPQVEGEEKFSFRLKQGSQVRLKGLRSKPENNGKQGMR